ncbi:aminotransferase class V-fold PLP-dependent enzyme [Paenibacillus sp. LMG 31461]|uniref:Aminotransferase class V-fold PLP-dependent enzyme n=1 Tax=Paenibacillus plantarum TaxID=2654975 RepID=A0ABX1XJT1_9BACL|nr:cysteine desulfurase family protein [Paenibacillus plantarum]NOU68119.1 aminotransferase class V-fold PLP-dependent enzyme [Paenibacillus plantarum]
MLYMDYAATSPLYEEVIDTIAEVMKSHYGNPSSIHRLGVEAEKLLQSAKGVIATSLKVSPSEIICTSGGTESNNLAIKGVAYNYQQRGKHLITTQIEHPSVKEVFAGLEQEGFRVTYLPVSKTGCVKLEDLQAVISEDTILVSIMYVNNEIGTIQPIQEIGQYLAGFPKIIFHVDAVQGIAKLPLEPKTWGIDLCSASAHKFRGPKGAGFLYRRAGVQLKPLLAGGGQEFGVRSGTENVPLIVGMAKALRISMDNLAAKIARKQAFRQQLLAGIGAIPELSISGSAVEQEMAPHIVHFAFAGMKAEVVVHALEQKGIYISTRSACSSGESEPSEVMLALGYPRDVAASGLRISFSDEHQAQDIALFLRSLQEVVKELAPMRNPSVIHRGKRN